MKIVVVHSNNFDFVNELYNPIRNSDLNTMHEFLFPHEEEKEASMTKEVIKKCDIVVAEVSYPSTGSGIELGWADVFAKPIICIYREGSKISNSLRKITQILVSYTDSDDMLEKLKKALAN